MNQLKIFIELTRLNKPIGFMLLFWPCSWGLAYAYNYNQTFNNFFVIIPFEWWACSGFSRQSSEFIPAE